MWAASLLPETLARHSRFDALSRDNLSRETVAATAAAAAHLVFAATHPHFSCTSHGTQHVTPRTHAKATELAGQVARGTGNSAWYAESTMGSCSSLPAINTTWASCSRQQHQCSPVGTCCSCRAVLELQTVELAAALGDCGMDCCSCQESCATKAGTASRRLTHCRLLHVRNATFCKAQAVTRPASGPARSAVQADKAHVQQSSLQHGHTSCWTAAGRVQHACWQAAQTAPAFAWPSAR